MKNRDIRKLYITYIIKFEIENLNLFNIRKNLKVQFKKACNYPVENI